MSSRTYWAFVAALAMVTLVWAYGSVRQLTAPPVAASLVPIAGEAR